jgi:hypothetical protein
MPSSRRSKLRYVLETARVLAAQIEGLVHPVEMIIRYGSKFS